MREVVDREAGADDAGGAGCLEDGCKGLEDLALGGPDGLGLVGGGEEDDLEAAVLELERECGAQVEGQPVARAGSAAARRDVASMVSSVSTERASARAWTVEYWRCTDADAGLAGGVVDLQSRPVLAPTVSPR